MMVGAPHANMAAALAAIVRSEGAAALFNGVLLSLVKQGPQVAITMSTYEVLACADAFKLAACKLPSIEGSLPDGDGRRACPHSTTAPIPPRGGGARAVRLKPPLWICSLLRCRLMPDALPTGLQMAKQFLEL